MSTRPAKSSIVAGAAAGVEDWARAGIGRESIRTVSAMRWMRCMENLPFSPPDQLARELAPPRYSGRGRAWSGHWPVAQARQSVQAPRSIYSAQQEVRSYQVSGL